MLKPTAHLTIDSTKVDPLKLEILEGVIHGTEYSDPRLPMPWEVYDLLANDPPLGVYQEPERPDNNLFVRGVRRVGSDANRKTIDTGERYVTGEAIWESEKIGGFNPPVALASRSLTPGTTYSLSVWAKTTTPGSMFYIGFYLAGTGFLSSYTNHTLTQDWRRWSVSFTADENLIGTVDVYMYPFGTTGSTINAKTQWTSPKLEIGPVATPWPPTPYSVSGYSDVEYATGHDLRGYKDEGIYRLHEYSNLTEQGVGLYGL